NAPQVTPATRLGVHPGEGRAARTVALQLRARQATLNGIPFNYSHVPVDMLGAALCKCKKNFFVELKRYSCRRYVARSLPPTYQSGLNEWNGIAFPSMKYPLYGSIIILSL